MLILLSLLFLKIFNVSAQDEFPVINGYYVTDLYPWDETSFQSMALKWGIGTDDLNDTISMCVGLPYLGGLFIFTPGGRVDIDYGSLPPHNTIYYHFQLFFINSWKPPGQLIIYVEEEPVYSFMPGDFFDESTDNKCGNVSVTDFFVIGKVAHSLDTLKVKFTSSKEFEACTTPPCSYGIRQVKIRLTDDIETSHSCAISSSASNASGTCGCGSQNVIPITPSPGMSCQRCHDSCDQCYGLTDQDCIGCASGFFYDKLNNKCAPCALNCLICSGSSPSECALCKPNLFQYPNNTCSSTCGRGLVLAKDGVYNKCGLKCDDFYVLANDSCVSSCLAPSIESNDGYNGIFYCQDPSPSTNPTNPTQPTQHSISCEYPYKNEGGTVCVIDLRKDEADQVKNLFEVSSLATSIASAVATLIALINFNNPTTLFLVLFVDLQRYYKYMKITYPPKLLYYLELELDFSILSILDPPEEVVNAISYQELPDNFQKGNFHSSFLVNFWRPLMNLLIIMSGLLLTLLLEACTKKCTKINSMFITFKHALKWNFALSFFNTYFGEIILYSSFEFRNADPSSFFPILSFMVCCFLNFLSAVVYGNMVYIIRSYWNKRKTANSSHEISKTCEVLIASCKDKSFLQLLFVCFYIGRVSLFLALIAYLFEHPLPQNCVGLFLSCIMLLYLAIKRPLKDRFDLANYLAQELVMLVQAASLLGFSILDYIHHQDQRIREVFGEIIIYSNTVSGSAIIVYIAIQILLLLKRGLISVKNFFTRKNSAAAKTSDKIKEKKAVPPNPQAILPPLENVRVNHRLKDRRIKRYSSKYQDTSSVSLNESKDETTSQTSFINQSREQERYL